MVYHPLFNVLPKEQVNKVFSWERCELDGTFLGFTDIYENLSKIIPEHFDIIDFGCYAAAQCYYFRNHNSYIGVDVSECERFSMENTRHYIKSIQEFLKDDVVQFNLNETFAISSYVSDFDASKLIGKIFKNVFIYYPHGSHKSILKNKVKF